MYSACIYLSLGSAKYLNAHEHHGKIAVHHCKEGWQQALALLASHSIHGLHLEQTFPVHRCTASSSTAAQAHSAVGYHRQGSPSLTRERPWQGAWVRHVAQRHRGWPVHHVVVGHGFPVALHAWAQHPLADEVHCSHHKHCEDHTNDGAYSVAGLWCRFLRGV